LNTEVLNVYTTSYRLCLVSRPECVYDLNTAYNTPHNESMTIASGAILRLSQVWHRGLACVINGL